MKLSNDQKKIAKALAFFPIVNIVTLVIYHLIKGDIDWAEILLSSITVYCHRKLNSFATEK